MRHTAGQQDETEFSVSDMRFDARSHSGGNSGTGSAKGGEKGKDLNFLTHYSAN
jgi:hypothetical protein